MGDVIAFQGWRQKKGESLQAAPALACPKCGTEVAATNVQADSTTTYRCAGNGHRAITWRIDGEGNMLRGAIDRRYY
jgi:hypothetical protein